MELLVVRYLLISCAATVSLAIFVDTGATLVGPSEPGTLVKGPSSKATVKGPSGPIIATSGDTGAVASAKKVGGVVSFSAQTAGSIIPVLPVAPAPVIPAAPEALIYQEPIAPYPQYDPLPAYAYPVESVPLGADYYGKLY